MHQTQSGGDQGGGAHAASTNRKALFWSMWGMALGHNRHAKGGEKEEILQHAFKWEHDAGGERREKGTYNLILGELLDEQKNHVRGAVLCVKEGACVSVRVGVEKGSTARTRGNLHETGAARDEDVLGRVLGLGRLGGVAVAHGEAWGSRGVCGCCGGVGGRV